jgi:hypothetical protein
MIIGEDKLEIRRGSKQKNTEKYVDKFVEICKKE